jgi:hypothetical protein
MATFRSVVAKGLEPDEDCLICNKKPKEGTRILRVQHDGFDLYYCLQCIKRGAKAFGLVP